MATKPLKTITFEGLDDTYTIPQIDNTLSVTGGAADAKAAGDEITGLKEDLTAETEARESLGLAVVSGSLCVKYAVEE